MKQTITVILTAWKEEKTIPFAIKEIITQLDELGLGNEIIQACPDIETIEAAKNAAKALKYTNLVSIHESPKISKPNGLNLAMAKAKGNIWVLTDGDVLIDKNAIKELLKPFKNEKIGGVTGRPMSKEGKETIFGYWGHLFMDTAHKKRMEKDSDDQFYDMSGYLFAMRADKDIKLPLKVLDDQYYTHYIRNKNLKISYAPEARVFVKQPSTLKDWIEQKVRNISGNHDMHLEFPELPRTRIIWNDLAYMFVPFIYAKTFKEYIWTAIQYPLRLYIWFKAWWTTNIKKMRSGDIWERAESTK